MVRPLLSTSNREPGVDGAALIVLTAKMVWLIMDRRVCWGRVMEFWYSTVGSSGEVLRVDAHEVELTHAAGDVDFRFSS